MCRFTVKEVLKSSTLDENDFRGTGVATRCGDQRRRRAFLDLYDVRHSEGVATRGDCHDLPVDQPAVRGDGNEGADGAGRRHRNGANCGEPNDTTRMARNNDRSFIGPVPPPRRGNIIGGLPCHQATL
jgi:hypothetical protein